MKWIFSSADASELSRFKAMMGQADIPCVIRDAQLDQLILGSRQGRNRLGQDPEDLHPQGNFTGAGPEEPSINSHDIPDVQPGEDLETPRAQLIPPEVPLNPPGPILELLPTGSASNAGRS